MKYIEKVTSGKFNHIYESKLKNTLVEDLTLEYRRDFLRKKLTESAICNEITENYQSRDLAEAVVDRLSHSHMVEHRHYPSYRFHEHRAYRSYTSDELNVPYAKD